MYKCRNCGEEFEIPETESEFMGVCRGEDACLDFDVCPYCGYDDIVEDVGVDVYDDHIYPGDTYYDFDSCGKVLLKNLKEFLSSCEVEA